MNGGGGPVVARTAAKSVAGKLTDSIHGTTAPRQIHVVATATQVVSPTSGRARTVLVWRCPVCPGGALHVSHGRGDLLPAVLERRTAHGLVVLHVASAAVAA